MLTTLAVLATLASANAQVVRANPGPSAFRWMNEFELASAPKAQDVMGYYSGRCYAVAEPDKPLGYALLGEARWVKANPANVNSAAVRGATKVTVVGGWILRNGANTPDEFDNPSAASVNDMKAEMDRVFADSSFTELAGGDDRVLSTHGRYNVRFEVRATKRYFMVRMARPSDNADLAYCHFFRTMELRQRVASARAASR